MFTNNFLNKNKFKQGLSQHIVMKLAWLLSQWKPVTSTKQLENIGYGLLYTYIYCDEIGKRMHENVKNSINFILCEVSFHKWGPDTIHNSLTSGMLSPLQDLTYANSK